MSDKGRGGFDHTDWQRHVRLLIAPNVAGAPDRFRSCQLEGEGTRIFGGQILAQGLMAASHDVTENWPPHAIHACFLRPGDTRVPVDYEVCELLAGRSFVNRQVHARQGGRPILVMTASFHRPETGMQHQAAMRTSLPPEGAVEQLRIWRSRPDDTPRTRLAKRISGQPLEIVPIDPDALFGDHPEPPASAIWLRMLHRIEGPAAMHCALLAYASDIMLLRAALLPHGVRTSTPGVQTASLDHVLWLHDTPDINQWHCFEIDSPWSGGNRGLSRGHFYTADGKLIATVAQESLMRSKAFAVPREA